MWLHDATTGVSYELLREIHDGGEGRTWQARQLGRSTRELAVAVKILSRAHYFDPGLSTDEIFGLWQMQAEIIRYFTDRAFVPIQAVFKTTAAPGRPRPPEEFLCLPAVVTAWVDGEGLREWSRRVEDPLSRLAVLQDCAAALDRFHRETGYVHRDLNPDNILVASDGTAVIIDYGLLRDASIARTGTQPVGTDSYIAPEILEGEPYSSATDRYSFAAILFHQLLRRDPPSIRTGRRQAFAAQLADGGYRPVASLISGWLNDAPQSRPPAVGAVDMLARVMQQVRVAVLAGSDRRSEQSGPTGRMTRSEPRAEPLLGIRAEPLPGLADLSHDGTAPLDGTAAFGVPVSLLRTLLLASVIFVVVLAVFAITHLLS